jgi:hypothetical protein
VDQSGHLRNRQVTLLRTGGDLVYISGGLDNGDLVSLTTLDSSLDGTEVRIESSTPSNQLDQNGRPQVPVNSKIKEVTVAVKPPAGDGSDG